MGRTVARLAESRADVQIVGGIDRDPASGSGAWPIETLDAAGDLLARTDVVIDFSAPAFLASLLERHRSAMVGVGLVVGTTGLGDSEQKLLAEAAESSPVLTAANFSVGVNLLLNLVETAARSLGPEYDIEVVETHHRRKEDAPSGTALALAEAAAAGRDVELQKVRRDGRSGRPGARPRGEIGLHAMRGGDVIGDHQVHLIGDLERIEIAHRASDRALFADGALRAAAWLQGREPGRYTMKQVLGL